MSKRNSIIIILVASILIIGGLVYFYFSASNKPIQNPQNITPGQGNIFGTPISGESVGTTTTGGGSVIIPERNLAKLIQIYKNPSSGSIFFTNKNNLNVLRFISRNNGNVYEYIPESETGEPIRITNTTIPKIQESVWSSLGDNLIYRYLDSDTDNMVSFSGKIKVGAGTSSVPGNTGEVTGSFLPPNIIQAVSNPKGDKIFGLSEKSGGQGSVGITYTFSDNTKRQIFDSLISLWLVSWPKDNIITFTTKPSFNDPGYLFFYNTDTGAMDRILGDIFGMTTLTNKKADLVAYSTGRNNLFSLFVYDVKKKENKDFKLQTLSDKCVWGIKDSNILYCAMPKGIQASSYPDDWYQGLISFSDDIWMVDFNTMIIKRLYQIGSNGETGIDAIDLKISNDDKFLTFVNKNDLSLWLLKTE